MEQKSYEVLTDNWPRNDPAGAGAIVLLTEVEAKYSILSGDLKLAKEKRTPKPKVEMPPDGGAGAGEPGAGEGERA